MARNEARTTPSNDRSWHGWLAGMPTRGVHHPWPFPVSGTPGGLARNVVLPVQRLLPEKTHRHRWQTASAGVPKASERCRHCGKTRAEVKGQAASPDPMAAMATAGEPMSKTTTKPVPSKMAAPKMPPKGKAPPPKGKKGR